MRRLGFSLLSSALLLLTFGPVFAQGWIEYRDIERGFGVNFPGEPTVEEIVWESEYGAMLPAHVFRADTPRGEFSMTVVDYREAERIQAERAQDCPEGAETCSGSTASTGAGYWRVDSDGPIDV